MDSILIFVYGTLLRGEANHSWLGNAQYLGPDSLSSGTLVDLGDYPMLIPGTATIGGELYGITQTILADLDELEEHPTVYCRRPTCLTSGRLAWVYWGQPDQARDYPPIPGGSWRAHRTRLLGDSL
jgi:gamma-glutamylcyclotransferase (GGCT)/AIG2-like uncharacterized protein YtfP